MSWHARSIDEILDAFDVSADRGLSAREAESRQREHGLNQLQEAETRPWWRIAAAQLHSVVVYLLGVAAVLAFATERWPEGIAVVAVIVVNAAIGFVSEWRAMKSMAALRQMGQHHATVRRDGQDQRAAAPQIVPGDIVLLEAGDLVPADLRLVDAGHLRVNESALTGESVPVDKTTDAVAEEAELAERTCMLFKATAIADGSAVGIAVATGPRTELGRIAQLAEDAEGSVTPMQKRLDGLGRRLAWLTIGIGLVVALLGLLVKRQEATLVVETALALAIAAIPEGLPVVATIGLARGMHMMARRHALINRLAAVETLGATRVVFADKTGTLTHNRMQLDRVVTPDGSRRLDQEEPVVPGRDDGIKRAMEAAVLCNAASLEETVGEDNPYGDPTEVALLAGGRDLGLDREELLRHRPEVRVEQFDPRIKKMATFHRHDGSVYVAVKGAPNAVLDACRRIASPSVTDGDRDLDEHRRMHWQETARDLANRGLRVLAAADKWVDEEDAAPYEDLCFLGLVGLRDPARPDVKAAIDSCQAAGVRVEMVTGDQPETARAIAEDVGMVGEAGDPEALVVRGRDLQRLDIGNESDRQHIHRANIFARVSPEQKLQLVKSYQHLGEIVAMTGDGVNDAPALKTADIGVAMGKRGTQAAKQVADMVLEDDSLSTIVAAVEQGRVIFANIRRSVMFMLCTNIAEVLVVTIATVADWTLPIRPLQILFLNVLTDVFPALALGVGPGSGHEMKQPPREPDEPVLTTRHWLETGGWSALLAGCVLGSLLLAEEYMGLAEAEAVTVSFLTLAFGKLWFTFNLRRPSSPMLRNEVTTNRWVWAAIALCAALLFAAVYLPGLSDILQTRPLGSNAWSLLFVMSLIPLPVGQIVREAQRQAHPATSP